MCILFSAVSRNKFFLFIFSSSYYVLQTLRTDVTAQLGVSCMYCKCFAKGHVAFYPLPSPPLPPPAPCAPVPGHPGGLCQTTFQYPGVFLVVECPELGLPKSQVRLWLHSLTVTAASGGASRWCGRGSSLGLGTDRISKGKTQGLLFF